MEWVSGLVGSGRGFTADAITFGEIPRTRELRGNCISRRNFVPASPEIFFSFQMR